MPFELTWYRSDKALLLALRAELSMKEFIELNKCIEQHLEQCPNRIVLIVDSSTARFSPYAIKDIRPTQTYMNSSRISDICVVGDHKVNRLALLLLFNLCRPKLRFCRELKQVEFYIQHTN